MFFFSSKVIWEHHSTDFFYTQKKFSVPFTSRPKKSSEKKFLRIGNYIIYTKLLLTLKLFDPNQKSYGFKRLFLKNFLVVEQKKVA